MKKTVTPAVLAANRLNSKKSTGPRRCDAVKHNAMKHGLLTKVLRFQDEEQEREFKKFRHELKADLRPEGAVETMLVEEIAVCWWKVLMATEWELGEFKKSVRTAEAVIEAYVESSQPYSSFTCSDDLPEAARDGWECRELTIRVGGGMSENARSEKEAKLRQFEAKLGSAAESGMRYRSSWKRDLYKALETLRTLQNQRRQGKS